MTPQERELAKKRALAKARARARSNGQTMVTDRPTAQVEATSGNPTPGQQQSGAQGQRDQLAMFGKLDKAIEGNPGRVYAAGGQVTNATTFGAYDRLMAGVDQLYSRTQGESDRSYSDSLGDVRASRQNMREMHPVSSGTGDVVGLVAGGMGIDDLIRGGVDRGLAKLPQAKNAAEKAGRYGKRLGGLFADGVAQYGAWTLGARTANKEAEEGRNVGAQERLEMLDPIEALVSGIAGPAMSNLYRGGRGVMTGRVTPKSVPGGGGSAPALEEIQAMKSQAYQDAEALGVAYTPDSYANMVAKIENTLEQAGADPQLNSHVAAMLNNMQKRVGDQPITMQTLDKVRQQVRENVISPAYRAARDGDIRLGNIIIDEIDNFIASGVGAVSNNGQAGSAAIQKARALNSVWRKSQALQDAVENAQLRAASTGSGGNFENALRQEIRKIYQNPKKVAGFSEMERKAMKAVIEGDMGQNILRNIGKLSPQGNGLMAALGIGTTAANPVVAPIWLAGMGAKHLAQRGIKNKFDRLDEMVREGANNLPMKNITPPKAGGTPPTGGAPSGGAPVAAAADLPQLSPPARVTEQIPEQAYVPQAPQQAAQELPQRMARPQEPTTLTAAVRNLGGIKTRYGNFGENLSRGEFEMIPGLVNDRTGRGADDIVRALQEDGFDIVDENDLYRALNNERAGQKTYRIGEGEEYEMMLDAYNSRPMQNGLFGFGRKPQASDSGVAPVQIAPPPDNNLVGGYAELLRSVESSADQINAALTMIKGDKRLTNAQLEQLLETYTGYGKFSNRDQAIGRLEQKLDTQWKLANRNSLPMLNNPTVGGAVAGGMAGGSMAQDLDGDGRVSMQERYVQGSLGALAGGFGGRAIGKLDDRMISQGSRQVLEGGNPPSEAGFSKPGRTSDTIYAKSGRKYSMAEGSTMSKVIELARQGKTNTQIDEALGLSPGVAAHYRNVAKTGKPPVDMSPQSDSPVLTAGIDGRRRKDMLKDVMPKSQGARVPGTSKPLPMKGKDAPAAPAYRDDLTTAAVVGLPVGGAAGMYAYSMYKAEMYKRGQKDIPSFQEFMRMIEEEQRSRMGVPPRPGLKPQDLPQRVQG